MEFTEIRVCDPERPVDGYDQLVQDADYLGCLFLVESPRLVPGHPLPELDGELLDLCALELVRDHQAFEVVSGPVKGLFGGQGEVFAEERNHGNESMAESAFHEEVWMTGRMKMFS